MMSDQSTIFPDDTDDFFNTICGIFGNHFAAPRVLCGEKQKPRVLRYNTRGFTKKLGNRDSNPN